MLNSELRWVRGFKCSSIVFESGSATSVVDPRAVRRRSSFSWLTATANVHAVNDARFRVAREGDSAVRDAGHADEDLLVGAVAIFQRVRHEELLPRVGRSSQAAAGALSRASVSFTTELDEASPTARGDRSISARTSSDDGAASAVS